jgi:ADP-heptose:LPS heptosyltransferase
LIAIDLCGGLGDAFIKMHESTGYEALEALKPGERASIRIISHNPYAKEMFLWHPRADQIDVVVSKHFFLNYKNPAERRLAGIPEEPETAFPPRPRAPVKFYPSPADLAILQAELPSGPYLAVAPTASGMEIQNRNLPPEVLDTAVTAAITRGVPVVLLGRRYQGPHAPKDDILWPRGPEIVDLTDRLSVPGSVEAVKRARAVLSAHSCLLLISWYERKPVFALYPRKYAEHDFWSPSPFSFGKDYPECVHMLFEDYTRRKFENFLSVAFAERTSR